MEAAKKALENSAELFPQLDYQKRVMAHSMKRQKGSDTDADEKRDDLQDRSSITNRKNSDQSNLPKQYRLRDSKSDSSDSDTSVEDDDGDIDDDDIGVYSNASNSDMEQHCDSIGTPFNLKHSKQSELYDSTSAVTFGVQNDNGIKAGVSRSKFTLIQDVGNDKNQQSTASDSSLESGEIS